MKSYGIKFVFFLGIIACFSAATHGKEYDFAFNVERTRLPQKSGTIIANARPSSISWRVGMQASLLPDFLKGSGELIFGNFAENSHTGFSDQDKYLLKLGVSGKRHTFGYGFNFYSVGGQYQGKFNSKDGAKKGHTGFESWLSWDIKELQLETKYSESWTNSFGNIYHVRTLDRWYEVETSYPLTSEPYSGISLVYGLGERRRTMGPDNVQDYEGPLRSLQAKFRFIDENLKFNAGVRQYSSRNDFEDRQGFQQKMVYFKGTLFPRYLLSINSSVRYSVNTHSSTAYKRILNKMESSLGLVYKSMEIPGHLKFTSAYNTYRSDDGLTNRDLVKVGAQFDWKSRERYTGLKTDWTVDLKFKDMQDYINPNSSTSDWSVNLLWRWSLT